VPQATRFIGDRAVIHCQAATERCNAAALSATQNQSRPENWLPCDDAMFSRVKLPRLENAADCRFGLAEDITSFSGNGAVGKERINRAATNIGEIGGPRPNG